MERKIRFGSGLHVFGSTADRYVLDGYKPAVPVSEMIKTAATVEDLEGIELVENWHVRMENVDEVLAMLDEAGLELSLVLPDLWAQAKWGMGSFASTDEKVRQEAAHVTKRAMDLAARTGCNLINVWFGQDGYDYAFQADYIAAWERISEVLGDCADHNPDVNIGIEYKVKEPRTHCFIGTIGKLLLLIEKTGRDNVGVVLDVGHSLAAYENMAESVALCKFFGDRLLHLHLNDNWRLWDDDMMVGSVHTIELLELLYWLERLEYNGWYSLDLFPYRDDSVGVASESLKWMKDLRRIMFDIGMEKIAEVIESGDAAKASKLIREGMLAR